MCVYRMSYQIFMSSLINPKMFFIEQYIFQTKLDFKEDIS